MRQLIKKNINKLILLLFFFPFNHAFAQTGYFPKGYEVTRDESGDILGTIDSAPGWTFFIFGEYDPINQRRDVVLANYAEIEGSIEFSDRQQVPVSLLLTFVCETGMAGIQGDQYIEIRATPEDAANQLVVLFPRPTLLRGRLNGELITVSNLQPSSYTSYTISLDVADMLNAKGDLVMEIPVAAKESPEELNGVQLVRFDTHNLAHVLGLLEAGCNTEIYR